MTTDPAWPPARIDRDPDLWIAAHPDSTVFVIHVLAVLHGIDDAHAMPDNDNGRGSGAVHVSVPGGSVFLADRFGNHPATRKGWGMRVGRHFHDGRPDLDLWTDDRALNLAIGVDHLVTATHHLRHPTTDPAPP